MSTSNATVKFVSDLRDFVEPMVRTMVEATFTEFPAEVRKILVRNVLDLSMLRDAAEGGNYPDDATRLAVIRQILADNDAWYQQGEADDHDTAAGTDPADTELPASDRPEDPDAGAAPPSSQEGEPDA